jgi:hypothetical protein
MNNVENTKVGIDVYMANETARFSLTITLIGGDKTPNKKWSVTATWDDHCDNHHDLSRLGSFQTFSEAAKIVEKRIVKIKTHDPQIYPVHFSYLSAVEGRHHVPVAHKHLTKKEALAHFTNEVTAQRQLSAGNV